MDESELQDFRRKRLADWLKENGGPSAVCQRRGLKKSVESHISQLLGGETFGQKAARNMEFKLGMDIGYLDGPRTDSSNLSPQAVAIGLMFDAIKDQELRSTAWTEAMNLLNGFVRSQEPSPSVRPVRAARPQRSHS